MAHQQQQSASIDQTGRGEADAQSATHLLLLR